MTETYVKLTASEISSLWTNYMNASMSQQILGFLLKDIEDPDIIFMCLSLPGFCQILSNELPFSCNYYAGILL